MIWLGIYSPQCGYQNGYEIIGTENYTFNMTIYVFLSLRHYQQNSVELHTKIRAGAHSSQQARRERRVPVCNDHYSEISVIR